MPSSSAHCALGSTTSAFAAVSEQHQVGDHEQVEVAKAVLDASGSRSRHDRVGAEHQQGTRTAVPAEAVHQLVRARSGPRDRGRIDLPDRGHVSAGRRVVDPAVARELVRLLAVFAPTLAVPLSGEAAVPAARRAWQPERQREVDDGAHRVHALRVLLGATGGEDERSFGLGEEPDGLPLLGYRDPRDAFDPFGPGRHGDRAYGVEAGRAVRDVRLVHVPVHDRDVQQTQHQCEVRARRDLKVESRLLRGGRGARVDHDERTAVVALRGEVLHERRHRLGDVGPDQQNRAGLGDVAHGERQAPVQAERPDPGRRGRRHAEPAVVVDVLRPQHHAGELPQRVRLLVGEATAAEHTDRVRSRLGLDGTKARRHVGERLVPGRRLELRVATPANQRNGEALGGCQQIGRRPALLAKTTPVAATGSRRHVDRRRTPDVDRTWAHPQLHTALQGAVRTVCRDSGHILEPAPEPFRCRFPTVSALLTTSHFRHAREMRRSSRRVDAEGWRDPAARSRHPLRTGSSLRRVRRCRASSVAVVRQRQWPGSVGERPAGSGARRTTT